MRRGGAGHRRLGEVRRRHQHRRPGTAPAGRAPSRPDRCGQGRQSRPLRHFPQGRGRAIGAFPKGAAEPAGVSRLPGKDRLIGGSCCRSCVTVPACDRHEGLKGGSLVRDVATSARGLYFGRLHVEIYFPVAGVSVNLFTILGLGGGIGLLSGIIGVGGGFLLTPLLIQIGIPAPVAAASAINQVTGASVSGYLAHRARGTVDVKMGLTCSPAAWPAPRLGSGSSGSCARSARSI